MKKKHEIMKKKILKWNVEAESRLRLSDSLRSLCELLLFLHSMKRNVEII